MQPILVAHLLPIIELRLIELLRSLEPDEWNLPTIAGAWTVKDITAHLLDTQLRKLSIVRDGYAPMALAPSEVEGLPDLRSPDDLVAFINRLNQEGVESYRRTSPRVLISMMELASRESVAFHQALDPMAKAAFAVSWAGEDESLNWFDTARELTERWHHQQQIRLATNRPGIMTPDLYHPVLDCFMRALPFKYRGVRGEPGTHLRVNVSGDCGGSWYLYRDRDRWVQEASASGTEAASVTIPQEIAWRVFTKGIDREAAMKHTAISGDRELATHVLGMVAIVG